jgi:hypothetical protein
MVHVSDLKNLLKEIRKLREANERKDKIILRLMDEKKEQEELCKSPNPFDLFGGLF